MGFYVGIGIDFYGWVYKLMVKILVKELEVYCLMFIEELVLFENNEVLREIVNYVFIFIVIGERMFLKWEFKKFLIDGYVDII